MFQHTASDLSDVVARTLALAKAKGAQAAEAAVSESVGLSVQVRLGETDQIEHRQEKSLELSVYLGRAKAAPAPPIFPSRRWPAPFRLPWTSPATPRKTPMPAWPMPI